MHGVTRLTSLVGVVILTLSMANPALGKTESVLAFDRLYYSPGEAVHLQTDFRTDIDGLPGAFTGSVEDGPYYAYLLPFRRFVHPPNIPKAAILLGRIQMDRGEGEGEWSASISFEMPHVEPDDYWVDMCNDPCRVNGVGDLGGGSLRVVATAEEARLMNLLDDWVNELIADQIVPVDVNEGDLTALSVKEALRDTRTRLELTERLEELQAEMASMRAQLSDVDEAGVGLGRGPWLGGGLVAAGIAALWWARSRRRSSERVQARPDPV
jgi:hypothetical protein